MNVVHYEADGVWHILILEAPNDIRQEQALIQDLDSGEYRVVELFGADIVSPPLIEAFRRNKDGLTLRVLSDSTSNYLSSLGIEHRLLNRRWTRQTVDSETLLEGISDDHLNRFLQELDRVYGYSFSQYNLGTLRKSMARQIQRDGFDSFDELCERLLADPKFFYESANRFLIGVTSFFRDPQVLKQFMDRIVPDLEAYPVVKIWVAGCSTGMEAYSLAMLLDMAGLLERCVIYATDINEVSIAVAENALYGEETVKQARSNFSLLGDAEALKKYFEPRGGHYRIEKRIRRKVNFFCHDLGSEAPFNEFRMIFCRNVMIYFDDDLKSKVLSLFSRSLSNSGLLVCGKNERFEAMDYNRHFVHVPYSQNIYKKSFSEVII